MKKAIAALTFLIAFAHPLIAADSTFGPVSIVQPIAVTPVSVSTVIVQSMPALSLTQTGTSTVTFNGAAQPISGSVAVTNLIPAQSTVSVVNFPAQSSTVSVTNLPAVTTITFNGASQPVTATISGTPAVNNTSVNVATVTINGTPSVSISGTPGVNATSVNVATVTISGTVPVSGTFWPATQPVSGTVSLATNTANVSGSSVTVSGSVTVSNFPATQVVSQAGTYTTTPGTGTALSSLPAANLIISSVGVAGAAIVSSCPAVASQFVYITHIEIVMYTTVARVGSATPVTVTTTNLPNALSFTFPTATAIGTNVQTIYEPANPIKGQLVGNGLTINCPATASVIWRVNVFYWTGT